MKHFPCLFVFCISGLFAQSPTVVATNLQNPSKLVLTSGGNLLVTEFANTPNSGRVSIVSTAGVRRTIIDGLPSGLSAPNGEADGPNGLALTGNTLYIAIGEGDNFVNGAKANTITPNPAGPSSPILASVLKVTLPGSVDTLANSFSLALKDHYTLLDSNPVTLTDASGNTAKVELVTAFRIGIPDAVSAWRNSHPYSMTLHAGHPDSLYLTDAGMNQVVEISLSTGRTHTLAHLASVPSMAQAPPVAEPVPTSIRPFGNQLLVSYLTGYPFTPGAAEVVMLDTTTGAVTPFIASLSSAIDVLEVPRDGQRSVFFTLEYSTRMLAGEPGRVMRYDTQQGRAIATGLNGPSSLAYDATGGNLYVALHSAGTIVKITGQ